MRGRAFALLFTIMAAGCAPQVGSQPTVVIGAAPPGPPLPPAPEPRPVQIAKAAPTMAELFRDPRFASRPPRSRQLVIVETQNLEALLDATPASSPDRAKIIRRLAENYAEMAHDARSKPGDPAREAAIRNYARLRHEYPKWCSSVDPVDPSKSTGCTDEVLYYLAYEHELSGNLDMARRVYLDLVQSWPQSRWIPATYLAFGELFFADAEGDPSKWALAEQCYVEVVKYPPPENAFYGYAQYQLGRVLQREDRIADAHKAFDRAVQWCSQNSGAPGERQLFMAAGDSLLKTEKP